jgi:hypothetical protein
MAQDAVELIKSLARLGEEMLARKRQLGAG